MPFKFWAVLVLAIIILFGVICLQEQKIENMTQVIGQKEKEIETLRRTNDQINRAWALEIELRKDIQDRQQKVDDALSSVDPTWGGSPLPTDVLRVLQAAGIYLPGAAPGASIGDDATPPNRFGGAGDDK